VEHKRTATATGFYDSFWTYFFFLQFLINLFVSQKSLNHLQARSYVQARGGSCLPVPHRLNFFETRKIQTSNFTNQCTFLMR